jgi:hypothetical protein
MKTHNRVSVKILLPADVYKKISETVRRFNKCGLWRTTLSRIFMVGYCYVETCGGLENFVAQIYAKKKLKKDAKGGGGAHVD